MREMLDGEVDAMSTRNTSLGAPTWTPCATRAPPRQHARDARRRGRRASTRNTSLGAPTWTRARSHALLDHHARCSTARSTRLDEEHLAGRAYVDVVRDTSAASTAVPEGDRRRCRRASTRNTSLRAPTWTPCSIARIARPSCLVLDGDVDAPRRGTPRWARPRGHRARHERRLDSMREMLDGEVDEEHLAGRAHVDAVRDTSAASTACARCSTARSTCLDEEHLAARPRG